MVHNERDRQHVRVDEIVRRITTHNPFQFNSRLKIQHPRIAFNAIALYTMLMGRTATMSIFESIDHLGLSPI